ncbi:MAG: hypothetical protein JSV76_05710 [Candidatus Bathyarchaeota archaeon]|nr:MAG: hypothetical protein JSV76_05710 [Candidatus Bathyarchaeota archaeon]
MEKRGSLLKEVVRQKLVASQINSGFLDLLKPTRELFPRANTSIKVRVFFDSDNTPVQVNLSGWKHNTPMLTGLTRWFRKNNAQVGDVIEIRKLSNNTYRLRFLKDVDSSIIDNKVLPLKTLEDSQTEIAYNQPKKLSTHPNFVIEKSKTNVLAWSRRRLPFEPKGWLIELRDAIRNAIRSLRSESRPSSLYGCYYSSIRDPVDVENVLFYNLGRSSDFSHLNLRSLLFERSFSNPPAHQGTFYPHFYYYSLEENVFKHWHHKEVLAEFSTKLSPSSVRSNVKPQVFWFAIKTGTITIVNRPNEPPSNISINVRLTIPRRVIFNLVSSVKPLIDGILSAFHKHEKIDQYKENIIASGLQTDAKTVRAFLLNEDEAILGQRNLLYKRGSSVQWNPADDKLVTGRLTVEATDINTIDLSGEVYLTIPKIS